MNFTSCRNLEWRWCDSWIRHRKKFQYLAWRCQNCHVSAKFSLRDQTFSLIRLHESYVRLGSNVKSSNMTFFFFYCNKFKEEQRNVSMWKSWSQKLVRMSFSNSKLVSLLMMNVAITYSLCWSLLEVIACMVMLNPCSNLMRKDDGLLKPI